jgi:TetR/AcrR family transcriptional repressor of lmrAB and yxaGH operons
MPTTDPLPGTRDRLVAAMYDALQRRGLHGMGLNELLLQAQAPKGVLYHHFPAGKSALAVAAIEEAIARLTTGLDGLLASKKAPAAALRSWMASAQKQLEGSLFERGCPLATVALESTAQDTAIRQALAQGFEAVRERLGALLGAAGMAPAPARQLAALIVAAYEGALLQARVAGHAQVMSDTTESLIRLVEFELQSIPTPP